MDKVKKPRPKTVGERIAVARDAYRLTQAQLGHNVGVTRAAISQYEQDKITPRRSVVDRLAELFNADPEWFERGKGKAPDPLDAPVTIHEISVELLTPQVSDLIDLSNGRKWRLPTATFPDVDLNPDHIVAILAPNGAGPIACGDRVLIDTRRQDGGGVFLFVDPAGAELRQCAETDAGVVGKAVAFLRSIG